MMMAAALATRPIPIMVICGFTNRIMSKMAYPASASPPGESMYTLIGSLLSSSRRMRERMTLSASCLLISPDTSTVRDLSIRLKSMPSSARGPFSCSTGLSCMFILIITIRNFALLDNAAIHVP